MLDASMVVDIGRQAIWATVLISAPLLVVALAVGLVIGIIQAATSINEMTLSFIPKLVAIGLALLLFGNWMLGLLVEFSRGIFQRIPTLFS
jgi:flagellar biosynthetic protein FliQ